jgi:hypothetical protein
MVVEIEMEAYNANTSPLFTSTHGSSSPLFTRNSNMNRDHEKLSSNTDKGFLKKTQTRVRCSKLAYQYF